MTSYKKIKNVTLQGLEVVVRRVGGGFDHLWIPSKGSVIIPAESITETVQVGAQRQMLKITKA
tara:strand:+ start:2377 stop:2565 length:189 start_codon:yes stop_codon:yes gene_type:complete